MSDIQLARIFSVWLPIGMMIFVKMGNNLASSGIVYKLYLTVSNLESLLKNMFIGKL